MFQCFILFIFIFNFSFAQEKSDQDISSKAPQEEQTAGIEANIHLQGGFSELLPPITHESVRDLLNFVGLGLYRQDGSQELRDVDSKSRDSVSNNYFERLLRGFEEGVAQLEDSESKQHFEKLIQELRGQRVRPRDPVYRGHFEQLVELMVERVSLPEDFEFIEHFEKSLKESIEDFAERIAPSGDPALKENIRMSMERMMPILIRQIEKDEKLLEEMEMRQAFIRGRSLRSTVRGYFVEGLVYTTVMGASMYETAKREQLLYGGRTNPVWMEDFLNEIHSPIGIFALFCFFFFSGETNYLYAKLLLDGFVFKRGPFKGYTIKPLMPIERTEQRLVHLRKNWMFYGRRKESLLSLRRAGYVGSRMGRRFVHGFGRSLSLAAGMTASDIVHEIEYVFGHSTNFKRCRDAAINSEDATSACELFWGGKWWQGVWIADVFEGNTEMGSVLRSFLPNVLSLVTASLISHAITQSGRAVLVGGASLSIPFVKGLTIRVVQNIPIEATIKGLGRFDLIPGAAEVRAIKGLVTISLYFVPITAKVNVGGRIIGGLSQMLSKFLSRSAPVARAQVVRNTVGLQRSTVIGPVQPRWLSIWNGIKSFFSRATRLFVFFKTDELITTPMFNRMKDNMKATELVGTIETFEQYYQDNPYTAHVICRDTSQGKPKACWYHPRIVSLFKISNGFDRWRLHQIEEAASAQMNWVRYVSNAIGYFEYTYKTYRELFQFEKEDNRFDDRSFYVVDLIQMLEVSVSIVQDIETYFQNHPQIPFVDIQFFGDVVAYSPSSFLKSDINWDRSEGYHLSVLRGLFRSFADLDSIDSFYENWTAVFMDEKEKIDESVDRQEVVNEFKERLDAYFRIWEKIIVIAIAQEDVEPSEAVIKFYNGFKKLKNDYKNKFRKHVKALGEEDIYDDEFSSTEGAHRLTVALSEHFRRVDRGLKYIEVEIERLDVQSDAGQYLAFRSSIVEIWSQLLGSERQKQFYTLLDEYYFDRYFEYLAENTLGQRVLAAGFQYLNELIRRKTRTRGFLNSSYVGMTRQRESEGLYVPDPALPVFYKLGPDNIFARLYAKTFVDEGESFEQINPYIQSMRGIEMSNQELPETGYKHPKHLKRLYTPYVTDFIVASALCGPDLNTEGDLDVLGHIQDILSYPDPQTAFEIDFANQSLDDVINLLPVFDHKSPALIHHFFGSGLSYGFYPPRIVHLESESEREAICNGFKYDFTSETPYHADIYDGYFPVGDRVYDNILHLVLDSLKRSGFSSGEEFDRWWDSQVRPYYDLFVMAMEREYENVSRYFIKPLFHTGTSTKIIGTNLRGSKFLPDLQQTDWSTLEKFSIDLPEGIFLNMHFEISYLSDTIFHFASISVRDLDESQLKYDLLDFADQFRPDRACLEEYRFFHERVEHCRDYAQSFLKNRKALLEVWQKMAKDLNINLNTDRFSDVKQSIEILLAGLEGREKPKIGSLVDPPSVSKDQGLPQALIEFSMIRMYHVLSQAIKYAYFVKDISDSPSIKM